LRALLTVTRIVGYVLVLVLGVLIGLSVCRSRSSNVLSVETRRGDRLARKMAKLRNERDELARELATSRRNAAVLRDAAESVKRDLQDKLTRLEQLVAALVGTRTVTAPSGVTATPVVTPTRGEVRRPD
jgi:hypothetical protein